jgi:methionine synthase II (cobalamin-independent)
MLDRQARAGFYQDRREQVFAFSRALNAEYHRRADAGCAVTPEADIPANDTRHML